MVRPNPVFLEAHRLHCWGGHTVAQILYRFAQCTLFSQKHLRCLGSRLVALAARERYGSDERVDGGETLGNRSVGRERMEATTGWTEKKPWEI